MVQTAFFGGYAVCEKSMILSRVKNNEISCEEGFTFDPVSTRCYNIPDVLHADFLQGCRNLSASYLPIQFENDEQVGGFMDLLNSGKAM